MQCRDEENASKKRAATGLTRRGCMAIAICINCGNVKDMPADRCSVCGFTPTSGEEKAKSMVLSTAYDVGDRYFGKSKEELLALAPRLADRSYVFDTREVELLQAFVETVLSDPNPRRTILLGVVQDNAVAIIGLLAVLLFLCQFG
jgi:hypothetical protein